MMKLKNLIALGILGVLTLGVGVGVASHTGINKTNASNSTYIKIESTDQLVDGQYLIITNNSGTKIFDGSLSKLDAASNFVLPLEEPVDNTISGDYSQYEFTINSAEKTIKSYSGFYIYNSGTSNGLSTSTTSRSIASIDISGGTAKLSGGSTYLAFNGNSGQTRFRFFKSTTVGEGTGTYSFVQLYLKQVGEIVPVESITSNITDLTVYQGERFNIGDRISVSVLPENATLKTYSYSLVLGNPDIHCAEIDSTGYLKVYVAGTATIVITANDGSGVTEEINLTCVNDPALSLVYSGTSVAQKSGQPFDPTGLTFELTYEYKENTVVDSSDITFEPSIISNDTTVVTAKYGTLDPIEIKDIVVEVGPAYVLSIESGTNFITGSTLVGSTNETLYVENSNLGNDGLYWSAEVIPNDGAEASISPNFSELQFGKSGNVVKTANLTSEIFNFNNKNLINKVVVKAIGAASNSGFDVSVAIDGISLTSSDNSISGTNAKELVFTASEPLFGHVEIKLENTSLNRSSGMKITGIEIYATEDVTNKGLAYAFASKVEKADSCSSDNVALINEYALLSAEVKGIADQIVVYDYAPSVPKSGIKNHQYTVAEKMIYIGNTSNSVSTNGLLNNENSLIITVVVISIVSISIISLFILNKRRYIKK